MNDTNDAVELTRQLAKFRCKSYKEKPVADFIFKRLARVGLNPRKQRVNSSYNIIATVGKPNVILQSHLDTVGEFFETRETKTHLYGRGVADARGSVASMILACEKALKAGKNGFGLALTVDEEETFTGVKRALKSIRPKLVIVGEATNCKAYQGQGALIVMRIIARSKNRQIALEGMLDVINCIRKLAARHKMIILIDYVRGGGEHGLLEVIPSSKIILKGKFNAGSVFRSIQGVCKRKHCTLKKMYLCERTKTRGRLALKVTEAMYWARTGARIIILGPGDEKTPHTNKERVRKSELRKAVDLYYRSIGGN